MRLKELEDYLRKNNLLSVYVWNKQKNFVHGDIIAANNRWKNSKDAFGIYKSRIGRYNFFITDSNKGIPKFVRDYATEEDACAALVKKMLREKIQHQQSKEIRKIV